MRKGVKKILNTIRNALKFRIYRPWVIYGDNFHCQWNVRIFCPNKKLNIGDNVGIGPYGIIQTDMQIGSNVMVAPNVSFVAKDAHTTNLIGMPMYQSPRGDKHRIVIEDDVWIGVGCIVLSGVTIHKGAIVAAGSVVTKDVEAYSIIASTASKKIGVRFSEDEIFAHEKELC